MAHVYREVKRSTVRDPELSNTYGVIMVARIISLIGSIITGILALRFILSLLAANRSNAFASLIYSLSHPFVAPFFGLFNYQEQVGIVRFEFETLVAIAFWALVTWMVVRLITIGVKDGDAEV